MSTRPLSRLAAPTVLLSSTVLVLSACSSAYDGYMADGCSGLRMMAKAYVTSDQQQFDEGARRTGNFDPAGEEASGEAELRREVNDAWDARRTLYIGAYVPPEMTDGEMVWRHLSLTDEEQSRVDRGLKVCERY